MNKKLATPTYYIETLNSSKKTTSNIILCDEIDNLEQKNKNNPLIHSIPINFKSFTPSNNE